jgi:ATP-dependent Clp protease ATP-binding subunit ClpC
LLILVHLFFVGPTGNGKTRLAKMLSDIYYKDRFFKINCGEYSNPHEYAKLIGSPPGYVGYTDKSLLAEKAEKSNGWVFLFDEIEKAHPKFYDFLLNLMDEGKVMDANGKDLDFSRSLFIFTSNQGTGDIKHNPLGFGRTKKKGDDLKKELSETFRESVKKHFSPEFINRIDKTIIFNQLNKEQLLKVVKLELAGIPVKKTKELLTYIIENGYSEEYGGRHIAKFIKNNIAILIADAVLEGVSPTSGNYYTCKVKDNTPYLVEMRKK